jgi:hypothetical protein
MKIPVNGIVSSGSKMEERPSAPLSPAVKKYHATIRHCRVFRVELVLLMLVSLALIAGILVLLLR